MLAVAVRVRGRVQGVGYRAWCRGEAAARGLAGWVQNEADGSVSAWLEGPGEAVDAMIEAMRSVPPAGRVDSIDWEARGATGADGFRVLRG
ncbi:acylphosphatase [Tropicimonas sediminicola]|uniref:acylphosphatase n=1 Tax=Tropicimonas sediminicola TaxID=1031541 RepID=A0A239CP98_9RHOB|nr:acylphosphatase [Tropicimonas sediminicola]SNS21769.1 acylphosphatase [Tropicimonas sediminicola]